MVRIGIVGVGFMGWIHWLAAHKVKGAKVAAVVVRDPKKKRGDWRSIKGNFGPKGEKVDLSGVKVYDDIDALCADPDIDLVDICTPVNLHGDFARRALAAGKHVLIEKPISLDAADAKATLSAARKANRLAMVAHVLPFNAEWGWALDIVKGGEHGRLQAARFRRITCPPDWSSEIGDPRKNGGPAIDLHIHDAHFILQIAGRPRQVFSRGILEQGTVVHLDTQYLFDGPTPVVTAASGCLFQKGRGFAHGFELYLERATLLFDGAKTELLTADGKVKTPKLPSSDPVDAFAREIGAAVNAVEEGVVPAMLSGEAALDALLLCHKEIESVKSGKIVKF